MGRQKHTGYQVSPHQFRGIDISPHAASIGSQKMRKDLGDYYGSALRKAWPEVPARADFVTYWRHNAEITGTNFYLPE